MMMTLTMMLVVRVMATDGVRVTCVVGGLWEPFSDPLRSMFLSTNKQVRCSDVSVDVSRSELMMKQLRCLG